MAEEMTEDVNDSLQSTPAVNVKHGKRMRAILCHLAKKPGYGSRQDHIIRKIDGLYDEEKAKRLGYQDGGILFPLPISPSLRASYSRAFKTLLEHGLIQVERYEYHYTYKGRRLYQRWENNDFVQVRAPPKPTKTWTSKPWFFITPEGIEYVNK